MFYNYCVKKIKNIFMLERIMKYYLKMLKNTFNYKGITSRKEFWWPTLINLGVGVLFALVGIFSINAFYILEFILFVATLLPSIAIGVRRLHDVDRSGYNMFWCLFPVVGWVILVMYMIEKSKYNYYEVK